MGVHLIALFLWCVLLAVLGGWWGQHEGAAWGVALAAVSWAVLQVWRASRLETWLRTASSQEPPRLGGLWRDLAYRTQRVLRQHSQQAHTQSERLSYFLAAIQASPNGVTLLDAEGRIEWCNTTATSHLGIDPERDRLQHVVHLVRDPAFTRYFAQAQHAHEVTMVGSSATLAQPVQLSLQLYPYGQGQQLLLSRDITALTQADTMRRDFVANVSHEIRTPLTVLAGFVETLQSLPLNEAERANYLSLMATQAQRMQTLVQDLLTLSQLEGSPPPGRGDPVPLPELMAQVERDAQALSAVQGRTAQAVHDLVFAPVPQVMLQCARREIESAIGNLVSNAVRYTPAGGRIEVAWVHEGSSWVLLVRDTGPGIAPEHLPRLAERFYRVDRSRSRETGGTGLGLAIAKHVAQRHGGELRIDSRLGQGSCFMLVVPAQRLQGAQGVQASNAGVAAPL